MIRVMHMLHPLDATVGEVATTVRLGTRWADSRGDELILCVCDAHCLAPETCYDPAAGVPCANCERVGRGIVRNIWVGRFKDVPALEIEHEHEASSRCYSGLKASMERAYGNKFDEFKTVTVVTYQRTA